MDFLSDISTEGDTAFYGAMVTPITTVGASTYTVDGGDVGKILSFTDECTVSLADAVTVGAIVHLVARHANGITIQDNGSSTVAGGGALAEDGEASCMVVSANSWRVISAS